MTHCNLKIKYLWFFLNPEVVKKDSSFRNCPIIKKRKTACLVIQLSKEPRLIDDLFFYQPFFCCH